MKVVANILVLISVMLYSLSVPVTWGLYLLRADAIAKVYCVNPGKPSCHGKCHIAKLTTKGEEKSNTPSLIELNLQKPLLFFADSRSLLISDKTTIFLHRPLSSSSLQRGYALGVYHPPSSLI